MYTFNPGDLVYCCDGCSNYGYSPFEYASIQIALGRQFDVSKYVAALRKRPDFRDSWVDNCYPSKRKTSGTTLPVLALPDGTPVAIHDIMPVDIVTVFRVVAPLDLRSDKKAKAGKSDRAWFEGINRRYRETKFEKIFRSIEPVSIDFGTSVPNMDALADLPRMSQCLSKKIPELDYDIMRQVKRIELTTLDSSLSYIPFMDLIPSKGAIEPSTTKENPWRTLDNDHSDTDDAAEVLFSRKKVMDLDCLIPAVGSSLYHGTVDTPASSDWISKVLQNDPTAFQNGLWLSDSKTHQLYGGARREWLYVVGFYLDDVFHPIAMYYRPPGISLQFKVVKEIPLVNMNDVHNVRRILVNSQDRTRERVGIWKAFADSDPTKNLYKEDEWSDELIESIVPKRQSSYEADSAALKFLNQWPNFSGFIHMNQGEGDHHNEMYVRHPHDQLVLERITRNPRLLTALIRKLMKKGVPMIRQTTWLVNASQKAASFIKAGGYDIIYDDASEGDIGDLRDILVSANGKPASIEY